MRSSILIATLLICSAITGCTQDGQPAEAAHAAANVDWRRQCTTEGVSANSAEDKAYFERIASECEPVDACMLACIRSACAAIGGGCAHACSNVSVDNAESVVASYVDKSAYFCKWQPPNKSFKPKR
ncbi:hypothetical protein GCM10022229_24410 [Luteimonas lutimaris]|uniref:Lipoprotein n=1 Tax=Luteimonas lutimaris TaxID=698645 RepID=A0ABP7MT76_9GAMM